MDNLNFSWQGVIDGNGVGLAITGMLIVFAALSIISLFIAMLPKLLPILESILPEAHHHHGKPKQSEKDNGELLAAIGYAMFKLKSEKDS